MDDILVDFRKRKKQTRLWMHRILIQHFRRRHSRILVLKLQPYPWVLVHYRVIVRIKTVILELHLCLAQLLIRQKIRYWNHQINPIQILFCLIHPIPLRRCEFVLGCPEQFFHNRVENQFHSLFMSLRTIRLLKLILMSVLSTLLFF